MKHIIYLFLLIFLFSNCSHRITRIGYDKNKSSVQDCEVIIKKDPSYYNPKAVKVGEIKIGETGFSVSCSEEQAIEILKNEACVLQADLIIIKHENRPDFWSTCYRCQADFYKYSISIPSEVAQNDNEYDLEKVEKRVSKDRGRVAGYLIGSVVFAVLVLLLM